MRGVQCACRRVCRDATKDRAKNPRAQNIPSSPPAPQFHLPTKNPRKAAQALLVYPKNRRACALATAHQPPAQFALAPPVEPNANLYAQQKSLARIARPIATLLLAKSASFDQPGQVS